MGISCNLALLLNLLDFLYNAGFVTIQVMSVAMIMQLRMRIEKELFPAGKFLMINWICCILIG